MLLRNTLDKTNKAISQITSMVKDEYDEINYLSVLKDLHLARVRTEQLLSMHKYYKITPEAYENRDNNYIEIKHVVRAYETINDIARRYNVTVDEILNYNHITTNDLKAGSVIKVAIKPIYNTDIIADIPVYTQDIAGQEIYGRDISLEDIGANGDLAVLDPVNTLKQCIINTITTERGNYPADDFGVDWDRNSSSNLWNVKVREYLLNDYRLQEVNNLDIQREGNAVLIQAEVTTINNDTLKVMA